MMEGGVLQVRCRSMCLACTHCCCAPPPPRRSGASSFCFSGVADVHAHRRRVFGLLRGAVWLCLCECGLVFANERSQIPRWCSDNTPSCMGVPTEMAVHTTPTQRRLERQLSIGWPHKTHLQSSQRKFRPEVFRHPREELLRGSTTSSWSLGPAFRDHLCGRFAHTNTHIQNTDTQTHRHTSAPTCDRHARWKKPRQEGHVPRPKHATWPASDKTIVCVPPHEMRVRPDTESTCTRNPQPNNAAHSQLDRPPGTGVRATVEWQWGREDERG